MYVPPKRIKQEYAISTSCLRKWALQGKVSYTQLPGGKRLYSLADIATLLGDNTRRREQAPEKAKVVYARVSSSHQKADLDRQVQDLRQAYPGHLVLSDVGSGLNFQRRGLQALLELVFKRAVDEVVVAHRDRLCRFAFDLLETILKGHGVRLLVHSQEDGGGGVADRNELAQDLLAVVNFFVARHNGQRSSDNRRKRKSRDEDAEAVRKGAPGSAPE
jgi:predicted site-specific integrase-resolvase